MTWTDRQIEEWMETTNNLAVEYKRAKTLLPSLVFWCRQHPWTVFYTQTFRRPTSCAGAAALFSAFLAESSLRWTVTAALWAVEPHASLESHHVHALLSMRPPRSSTSSTPTSKDCTYCSEMCAHSSRATWEPLWRQMKEHGWKRWGIARVIPIRDSLTVAVWYVLKYVLKGMTEEDRNHTWNIWTAGDEDDTIRARNRLGLMMEAGREFRWARAT